MGEDRGQRDGGRQRSELTTHIRDSTRDIIVSGQDRENMESRKPRARTDGQKEK